MGESDYSNIGSVLIGAGIILLCIFVCYLAQMYFKSREKADSQKSDRSKNKPAQ